MNKQRIINFAHEVFSHVSEINENLFRGELKVKSDNPAGIYYLDFSNQIDWGNFSSYQEEIMAEDYYNNPGHMQWNYYLLLFSDQIDRTSKKEIERDHKFARKYVLNENEFESFFRPAARSSAKKSDLINEIKAALNIVDLQEIYSDAPVKSAFERFKRDEAIKVPENKTTGVDTDIDRIETIEQISINDNFRKFPNVSSSFHFGKVNLITGINGVGKTSLLESIELIVAGRTVRNESAKYPDGCVEAVINGSYRERVQPSNMEKYRMRDRKWYSKSYPRSNETHNSFNTYNFFNSDAAFNIAQSMDEKEISNALNNLILGPAYNYISERIKDFYEYIRPEANKLKIQLEDYSQRVVELRSKIEGIKLADNLTAITGETGGLIEKLRLKVSYNDILLDYPKLEIFCSRLLNTLDQIQRSSPEINSVQNLEAAREIFFRIRSEYNDHLRRQQELTVQINKLQAGLVFLRNCYKYLSHPLFAPMLDYITNYDQINQQLNRITLIESNLRDIAFPMETDMSVDELLEANKQNTQQLRREIDQRNQERLSLLKESGDADKELRMILRDLQDYIQNIPEIDHCPLCRTSFSREELLTKLNQPVAGSSKALEVESTEFSLITLRKQFDSLQAEIKDLIHFKNLEKLMGWPADASLQGMLLEIESLFSQSAELKASHKNYEDTRAAISKDQTISLEEFIFMQKRSATEGIRLEISSLPGLKEKLDESENTLTQLTLERHQMDEAMEKHLIEFPKRLGTSQDLRQLQVTSLITAYENILTELVNLFATLREHVELAPGTLLSQLRIDVAVWKDSLAVIRTEMTKSQNLKQHTDNLASAENFILRNTLTAERMEKARKTLSRLIENDGSSKLKDFFNQNLEEIANVFRAIHQPREFRRIDFQNNKLILTTLTEEKRTLNEVSSGQRSAIALAIFITLNRKLKDGPNIILFDDPVSYIDDMNSLSFLDFLRFFILNEGKQIFFATANDKLARLFQKKFEYLGDDFQRIELSRLE